jgi:hypothetical protein
MKIYDVDQIKKVINLDLSLKELINSQRQAFIDFSSGLYDVPIPMQLSFQEKVGDCHIKAGFKRNDDTFIIKVATGFYQNRNPDNLQNQPRRRCSSANYSMGHKVHRCYWNWSIGVSGHRNYEANVPKCSLDLVGGVCQESCRLFF